MKKIPTVFYLFICICFSFKLEAQKDKIIDIVYLIDGSIYKGDIIEYSDDILTLKLRENENIISINPSEVNDVEVAETSLFSFRKKKKRQVMKTYKSFQLKKPIIQKPYEFKNKGFYQTFNFQLNLETVYELVELDRQGFPGFYNYERQAGFGAHFSYGYRFRKEIGLGVGLGLDYYSEGRAGVLMPFFVEMRGYLLERNHTPFYQISTGLSTNVRDVFDQFLDTQIGFLFYPSIGYRIGSSADYNLEIGLGIKFQKFEYLRFNSFLREYQLTKLDYQRLILSVGFIF